MGGVYFAYDGSIHGDWVAHYAARLAAGHVDQTLHLIHVRDGRADDAIVREKTERINSECRRNDVDLTVHTPPVAAGVLPTICRLIPAGRNSYLVCGTRSRERTRGLLSGSVAEGLLRCRHCHILAIRVVQPGLLGRPRELLLSLSGRSGSAGPGLPFLRFLSADISQLHLLHVVRVGPWRLRLLSHAAADRLRLPGHALCDLVEEQILSALGAEASAVDASVVVSDNVSREIVIAANRSRSRLICLGASTRNLAGRFLAGNVIERVLHSAPCDVSIYRGPE